VIKEAGTDIFLSCKGKIALSYLEILSQKAEDFFQGFGIGIGSEVAGAILSNPPYYDDAREWLI
jgi:tRNA1(Val) A37 N6-methylase TrmN6